MIFFLQKPKVSTLLESLSLKLVKGSRVVHFTAFTLWSSSKVEGLFELIIVLLDSIDAWYEPKFPCCCLIVKLGGKWCKNQAYLFLGNYWAKWPTWNFKKRISNCLNLENVVCWKAQFKVMFVCWLSRGTELLPKTNETWSSHKYTNQGWISLHVFAWYQ